MKFMVIVKASKESEANEMKQEELAAMQDYNEKLVKAGVMLAGEGLLPSKHGVRIRFEGNKRTVIDGPFSETKELVAGFWILQCRSREEVIEWVKRAPCFDGGTELEIRQLAGLEDFAEVDPDGRIRAREEELMKELERQQNRR